MEDVQFDWEGVDELVMIDYLFKSFFLLPLVAFEEALDHAFIIVISRRKHEIVILNVLSKVLQMLHLLRLVSHSSMEYHALLRLFDDYNCILIRGNVFKRLGWDVERSDFIGRPEG